jgi:hypothetical protein
VILGNMVTHGSRYRAHSCCNLLTQPQVATAEEAQAEEDLEEEAPDAQAMDRIQEVLQESPPR